MSNGETQQIITLDNVRVSYLYAFKPYVGTGNDGKPTQSYCVHGIFAPDSPNVVKVKAAQRAVALAKWGTNGEQVLQQLANQDRICLHSGDRNKPGEDAYAGKLYVSANNRTKPRIVVTRGGSNVEIGEDDPCAPYSGCIGNLIVGVWAMENKFGKRINASFMGIQFVKHEQRLGGSRIATPDEFGIVPTDADGAVPMAAASTAGSDLV